MSAVPPNDSQQITEQPKLVCHYCRKPGHVIRYCRKKMREEQEQRNDLFNPKPETFDILVISTISSLPTDKPSSKKMLEWPQWSKQA